MSIQTALNTAIYTKLTAGTALTSILAGGTAAPSLYFEQAPDNAALPYVVWLLPSELDDNAITHRMKDVIVRAYGVAAAPAQAGTVDAQIDAQLHNATLSFGTASSWKSIWMRRENGYQLVSTSESGVRYYTSGADYRVNITNG
jgi:hypothetical protein